MRESGIADRALRETRRRKGTDGRVEVGVGARVKDVVNGREALGLLVGVLRCVMGVVKDLAREGVRVRGRRRTKAGEGVVERGRLDDSRFGCELMRRRSSN